MAVNNLNSGVGIQPTIVDAKGDLIAATANDAVNRLAVGTNGQVLVADSGETTGLKWNNPGTVGGLVHIETQTFSAVSSFSFSNNVFTTDYDNYKILMTFSATGDGADTFWRGRILGTDTSATNYFRQFVFAAGTGISTSRSTGQTQSAFATIDSEAGENAVSLEIFAPKLSAPTRSLSTCVNGNGGSSIGIFGGAYTLTTSFDSLSVSVSSGTITGKAYLYGVSNG